jgi:hypothetical protein
MAAPASAAPPPRIGAPPPVAASVPPPAPARAPVPAPARAAVAVAPAPRSAHAADDPERYRFLYQHFERKGDRDASYRAALCLEALGEADINESLFVSTHRPEGLQAVRGTLSYADWNERLNAGCRELETTALLRAIGGASLGRVGFQHVRRKRRELELPDEARQEPEKSTTTLAKTLHWSSRLLCVPAAELYVLSELPGSLGLAPGPEQPVVACSRALGSGFSLPELVFLWSRELSFARPEESALCYFPSPEELSLLLQAALAVGGTLSMRSIDADAKRVASNLKREVRGAALGALEQAAQRFNGSDVLERATLFTRGAELIASRVALVACGNLELALALDQRFPRGTATRPAERRADLLSFTVSPELGQIRATLGVALG